MAFVFDFLLGEGEDDIEAGVTYTALDMNLTYSVGYYQFQPCIQYKTVSFVKTLAEDGSATITATIEDEDGNTWHWTGTMPAPPDPTEQHLEYDTPDADFDHEFNSYDLNLDNLVNGYAVLTAYDTENMKMVYLQFWTRPGASPSPSLYTAIRHEMVISHKEQEIQEYYPISPAPPDLCG